MVQKYIGEACAGHGTKSVITVTASITIMHQYDTGTQQLYRQ
jgi:hypothetical protein